MEVQANQLANRFARVTGAAPRFFPAPGVVGTSAAHDALMADPYLQAIRTAWSTLTTLIAGIGTLQPSALLASSGNGLSEDEARTLRRAGAVGDLCLRFYDENGQLVGSDLNSRVLGIDPTDLRAVQRRIGIAGGTRKYTAIRGAVRGRWINILVTDYATALRLIDEP